MPTNSFTAIPASEVGSFNPGGPTSTFNPIQDPATKNYRLNHLALRITDPARSLHFYIDLLGMRIVFNMNAGPFTIYYLGYPPPDTSAKEVATWAEKTAQPPILTTTNGLLELIHVHGTENNSSIEGVISNGNVPPHLGFAHLGFTVPDVRAAVERLRGGGVEILKDIGVCTRESVPLSEWEAEREVGRGEIHGNYAWFFEQFAMVADPVS
ncbi:Lactoylglutathione lyase (Glo1) [Penicillium odoratum]|uniref:Lactoylglutathione lyase (Glo1) n=1 Tax=Penicillium odoratum TaxID=1167516 RepID=UPI002546A114|nr:Lactoylglutathione lyase (Glo1) [Penicillium odoratum]KAJ5759603.1 Lactoylglutathione lyase (Glo1) [Penicillium odoratum]